MTPLSVLVVSLVALSPQQQPLPSEPSSGQPDYENENPELCSRSRHGAAMQLVSRRLCEAIAEGDAKGVVYLQSAAAAKWASAPQLLSEACCAACDAVAHEEGDGCATFFERVAAHVSRAHEEAMERVFGR